MFEILFKYLSTSGGKAVLSLALNGLVFSFVGWERIASVTDGVAVLFLAQSVVLFFPLSFALHSFISTRNPLHPNTVVGATYLLFHVLWTPLLLSPSGEIMLASRNLQYLSGRDIHAVILTLDTLIIIGWFSLQAGLLLFRNISLLPRLRARPANRVTWYYLPLGVLCVVVGILGNLHALGWDWSLYVIKMVRFYERWEVYELSSIYGGTIGEIMRRFLPLGLLVLAIGYWIRGANTHRRLVIVLLFAGIVNVLLSSSTGQRSATMMVFFYGLIAWSSLSPRAKSSTQLLILLLVLPITFVLGVIRAAAYYSTIPVWDMVYIQNQLVSFFGLNLSNSLGSLFLVHEYLAEGATQTKTALSGLTGLLGGPTPLTTQAEVWHRLGVSTLVNPRYGAPSELLFNYGWLGPVIGMFLMGAILGRVSRAYDYHVGRSAIVSVTITIFCVLTAHFLPIANLSYIPPFFLLFSAPYIIIWVTQRSQRS